MRRRALMVGTGFAWVAQSAGSTDTGGEAPQPARTLAVGPTREVKSLADAARRARDGATIEVDAGEYRADTAVWTQSDLAIRAVGGRVRLVAAGASAEGKGIWVVRGERVRVQGFDFSGAAVRSRNGAGIRLERGSLQVRDCRFVGNEMGLLTGNDAATVLVVENSEFAFNGRDDGHNHQLYAGTIARLVVTGSYFHDGHIGHLLKSRAALSHVAYNRLTDEGGDASYELEFPNGGRAYVIGNIVQQGPRTQNTQIIAFGAEGYRWPVNELRVVHNTLVDGWPGGGVLVQVYPGAGEVDVVNNLFVGDGRLNAGANAATAGNHWVPPQDLASAAAFDLRLRRSSSAWGRVTALPADAHGIDLQPAREYRHPRQAVPLGLPPAHPGAAQDPAPDDRP